MTVTQIVPVTKSRSRIWIDDEPAFVLYKGELAAFHLAQGCEITQGDYDRIMTELLPKRAKLRTMNLLKSRDYTREGLRRKLAEGEYPEEIIEQAVEYVVSYGYVDDLRYAVGYISDYEGRKTQKMIETDLLRKGIAKNVIEQAWNQWKEKGGSVDEKAMIEALLKKRRYDPESADIKEKQRTYAFLARKGFSADLIMDAIR